MGNALDAVKRLVDRFYQNRKVFLSGDYKEEQLRAEFLNGPCLTVRRSDFGVWTFLDPFFTALGWDMDNKQGLSETFKQVIHEKSIKVSGVTEASDYPVSSVGTVPLSSEGM